MRIIFWRIWVEDMGTLSPFGEDMGTLSPFNLGRIWGRSHHLTFKVVGVCF